MERIPEPELMDEPGQVRAYAEADFEEPHRRFIDGFRATFPRLAVVGRVLDLGCGPGDITRRFLEAYPACRVDALDGAPNMLRWADRALTAAGVRQRARLIHARLPQTDLPERAYDVVISNSLLHHLHDPAVLWQALRRHGRPGAAVYVMDLRRPASAAQAQALVAAYAGDEPPVLRRDFLHSLGAAFEPGEVRRQLAAAGLGSLRVAAPGDRHLTVSGRLPAA